MIVISGFVGYRTQNEPVKLNDLCMANIEALSHSEGNGYETVSELYEFRKTNITRRNCKSRMDLSG